MLLELSSQAWGVFIKDRLGVNILGTFLASVGRIKVAVLIEIFVRNFPRKRGAYTG
jgi:hypothetical protein